MKSAAHYLEMNIVFPEVNYLRAGKVFVDNCPSVIEILYLPFLFYAFVTLKQI